MKKITAFIFAILYATISFSQVTSLETAMPKVINSSAIVKHSTYYLEYSEEHEQAKWVLYKLTPKLLDKTLKRDDEFRIDPLVITGSAENKDYTKSGYDRGHLKPANDSKTSSTDMSESFYFSNMSPQVPEFNRGIWKSLEEKVQDFAEKNKSLWVVTGPCLDKTLSKIGENGVSIPKYYYKVLLDNTLPEQKAIAFILPNQESTTPLENFACTVDKVEQVTGIDFFPNLEDSIENQLESKIDLKLWFPQNNSSLPLTAYIGNSSSKVVHQAKCKNANCKNCTIKFKTLKEAILLGYKPCSICNPK